MKRTHWITGMAIYLVAALAVIGCDKTEMSLEPDVGESFANLVSGRVVDDGIPTQCEVLVIWSSGYEELIETNGDGEFSVNRKELGSITIVAATLGKTGSVEVTAESEFTEIELDQVPESKDPEEPQKARGSHWFGVYDTDSHGDVRFRYLYNFSQFYCSSGLPSWLGDPNPNHWTSWNLTDFPPPWKGKKLLVPTRFQWWHRAVYGYSISYALYLISIS